MASQSFSFFSSRNQYIHRELLWVGVGQGIAVIGGFIGIRLLTGVLSPEIYGELALGMTVATLAQQTVMGPISGALLRFFSPAAESSKLGPYLQGMKILLFRASMVLLVIFGIVGGAMFSLGYARWLPLVGLASAFAILAGYTSALDGIQNAARQRPVVALHQGAGQWVRYLFAVAMVSLFGMSSRVAMAGFAIAAGIVLVSQCIFFRNKILPLLESENTPVANSHERWIGEMIGYAWPFATWGIMTWALMASDRWALTIFRSKTDVGLYAVLYQIGYY